MACTNWAPSNRSKNKLTPGVTLLTNAEMAKAAQVHPNTITDAKAAHTAGLGDAVKHGAMTATEAVRIARVYAFQCAATCNPARALPKPCPCPEFKEFAHLPPKATSDPHRIVRHMPLQGCINASACLFQKRRHQERIRCHFCMNVPLQICQSGCQYPRTTPSSLARQATQSKPFRGVLPLHGNGGN